MHSVHYSSKTPEWSTPQDFFDALNKEFRFTLDPAATKENAKCKKFYTQKEDGLVQSWKGERVFVNPPYGRVIGKWVEKMSRGGQPLWWLCYLLELTLGTSMSISIKRQRFDLSRDALSLEVLRMGHPFPQW